MAASNGWYVAPTARLPGPRVGADDWGSMNLRKKLGIVGLLVACVLAAMVVPQQAASAEPPASQDVQSRLSSGTTAAKAAARVTLGGGPRLKVRVGPSQAGPGAWKFTLERLSGNAWVRAGAYRTQGTNEDVFLPVTAGTYRVVVPAQHGYQATTSTSTRYVPTPDITVAGHGAIEVKVGPIRDWQVTLERQSDRGWSTVKTAKTRGVKRMIFNVEAGTYRVRTAANGRFPAYTGDPFRFAPQAPPGPIPYGYVDAVFSDAPGVATKKASAVLPRAASSSCASVMEQGPNIGLKVATGVINYIPYVGGILSSKISNEASDAQANAQQACISAQFATINAQLAYQESQIVDLQNQLNAAERQISQEFADAAKVNVQQEQGAFYNSVAVLAQCTGGGLFYDFMVDFGLWSGCYAPSGATVSAIATSSTFEDQSSFVDGGTQSTFGNSLQNVAGNYVFNCSGSLLPPAPPAKGYDCQSKVTPVASQMSLLQNALTLALSSTLTTSRQNSVNVVPLYDDYNQYLVTYYQQAVVGIQAAFTMESLVNQLNYFNAGQNAPIDSLGMVPGTYYSYQKLQAALGSTPSPTTQAQYYNRAQHALAQVYAARINQLYQDTIGYIVTDIPVGGQAWPSPINKSNANISYAGAVGSLATSDSGSGGLQASTPLGLLPLAVGTGWTENSVLYQYYGLRNAGQCYANLVQWNQANGTAIQAKNGTWYPTATPSPNELAGGVYDKQCPPILTTSTGGAATAPPSNSTRNTCATYAFLPGVQGGSGSCYDGNTLVPYYVPAGGLPELGSSVLTNLVLCNATDPALTWFQVGSANAGNAAGLTLGDWALTCGNWAAPVGPGYNNGAGAFPGSSPPTSWAATSGFNCPAVTNLGTIDSLAYAQNAPANCLAGYSGNILWGVAGTGVGQVTFDNFYAPGYYIQPNWIGLGGGGSPKPYIPPMTSAALQAGGTYAAPFNIGGSPGTVNVTIDSTNCYSNQWSTGVSGSSGCVINFSAPSNQGYGGGAWTSASAGLAALAVSLPNGGTGAESGGFALPIVVGTSTYTSGSTMFGYQWSNWLETWVNSGTSISEVGYSAPPSTMGSAGIGTQPWVQNGYITVADGSCWNINIGRNANNVGTISFNQVTPGSLCAS